MEKFKNIEKILKALANRRRLQIIASLRKKELPVVEIAKRIGLSFKSTSRHLAVLRQADIIEYRQKNLYVFYRIADNISRIKKQLLLYIPNSHE